MDTVLNTVRDTILGLCSHFILIALVYGQMNDVFWAIQIGFIVLAIVVAFFINVIVLAYTFLWLFFHADPEVVNPLVEVMIDYHLKKLDYA